MSLELLIGPMFAGKSSAIQSIVRRHQALGWPVFVITHSSDTRYSDKPAIVNHDGVMLPAFATSSLYDAVDTADFKIAKLVVIEEAQFFYALVPFVLHTVENLGKHVVVVGLDGDVLRRPFGKILDLVPYCDKVTKLTAMCKICGDGTPALFSHATTDASASSAELGVPCVGAADKYVALCRKHYIRAVEGPGLPTYDYKIDANGC
jgi:thymidine kinase